MWGNAAKDEFYENENRRRKGFKIKCQTLFPVVPPGLNKIILILTTFPVFLSTLQILYNKRQTSSACRSALTKW